MYNARTNEDASAQLKDKPKDACARWKNQPEDARAQLKDKPEDACARWKDQPEDARAQLKDKPEDACAQWKDQPEDASAQWKDVYSLLCFYVYGPECVYHVNTDAWRGQKRASDTLELEFQVIVSRLVWMLDLNLGLLWEQQVPSSPAPGCVLLMTVPT